MTGPARILFVDDEVDILEGLSDMLRKERKRWTMVFAVGAAAALQELGRAKFDIIVTDIRMPGMDGAQLLARVKADFPGVTRLVLSGHADRGSLLRAIPVAHQVLSKPCDAQVLRASIERAHALHSLLEQDALRSIVGKIDRLPSVPAVFTKLNALIADPSKGLTEIARVIESDPAMSAKILQIVGSPYFGLRRQVASIHQAISMLGVELVRGLITSALAQAAGEVIKIRGFSIEQHQSAAIAAAGLAREMVRSPQRRDEAFTAALLHDIGKIVLALGMPVDFEQVMTSGDPRPEHERERERFGVTHAEVGAYLLGLWGLPHAIVETAAYHHAPAQVREGDRELLAIVHAADALVDGAPDRLDMTFLEESGFAGEAPRWIALANPASRPSPEARR